MLWFAVNYDSVFLVHKVRVELDLLLLNAPLTDY
jgi:hypothetical protein